MYRGECRQHRVGGNFRRRTRLTALRGAAYMTAAGRMAEWLCRGLQILVQRFDSASGLHEKMNSH
jgi:hypothetical protein